MTADCRQRTYGIAARVATRPDAGFTLIEIMIVVVIIGLLAGLVAVNLLPQAEKAKQTAARSQMKSFENALELYKLDTGRFPRTEEGLEILVAPKDGQEAYLKGGRVPVDPWNNKYVYMAPGAGGQPYDILSYGADGQPGGGDEDQDISNWGTPAEGQK